MAPAARTTRRSGDKSGADSVVTSVRLPLTLLTRLQALATVMEAAPNALIVEAIDAHIKSVVGSKNYVEAKQRHRERLSASESLLEGCDNTVTVDFGNQPPRRARGVRSAAVGK